ncbi:MAG: ATP synthase subunit C [Treponema sp.]|jgi:V/A-type H+-transporting ATPase subunit K|nr:ATP synthase subunit C [Treponema sp.]
MKRKILFVCVMLISMAVFAQEAAQEAAQEQGVASAATDVSYAGILKYFAAALAVGISCIAGGMAVARIGSAAMGAMSENADLSGKALPYAGLAEGICLWGFLVALLILFL